MLKTINLFKIPEHSINIKKIMNTSDIILLLNTKNQLKSISLENFEEVHIMNEVIDFIICDCPILNSSIVIAQTKTDIELISLKEISFKSASNCHFVKICDFIFKNKSQNQTLLCQLPLFELTSILKLDFKSLISSLEPNSFCFLTSSDQIIKCTIFPNALYQVASTSSLQSNKFVWSHALLAGLSNDSIHIWNSMFMYLFKYLLIPFFHII